jgi:uncharacterized protein (DUF362 family)
MRNKDNTYRPAAVSQSRTKRATVALVRGNDRKENVARALQLIEDRVDVTKKESILIKPNFVSTHSQSAATHVDAVRAVLEFLRQRTSKPITIGESPALGSASTGYSNYGYLPLAEEFGVRLIDLDDGPYVEVKVYDRNFRPMSLHVSRTTVESDFRISVCLPKTHDCVIATLSLKNIVVGSLRSKSSIHQGYPAMNVNLYLMAKHVAPHLSVIDGYTAMEGNGPVGGATVDLRLAIASTDFLAADAVAARIMGFDVDQIGYLYYCMIKGLGVGDIDRMEILGDRIKDCIGRPFRPHSGYKRQSQWHVNGVERYL